MGYRSQYPSSIEAKISRNPRPSRIHSNVRKQSTTLSSLLSTNSNKCQKQISSKTAVRAPPTTEETDTLKVKKAWEVALAPVKQLPMTAIMMYMSGNSLQIFSIMMVAMAFKNPVMGLVATNQAFERFESEGTKSKLLVVKAVYVAMQILALALGVWKVNGMGLLP